MNTSMSAWKKIGGLWLAAAIGVPLFVSIPAAAATGAFKVAGAEPDREVCTKEGCSDRKLGTEITWAESPDAAWREAREEGKLVFLIQVSGNFARQEFT